MVMSTATTTATATALVIVMVMVMVIVIATVLLYFMSKTCEMFARSSEPEAHVKNARQQNRIQELTTNIRY